MTATAQEFDGSEDITIPITAVPASIVTGLATVATSGNYSDLSGKPTIPSAATTTPSALGTAAVGSSTTYARADHVHPAPTTITGNAATATTADKVKTNMIIKLNSGTTEGTDLFTYNGSTAKTINITPSAIGAAASSHGTHVTWSTTTPKANGTAAVGTETKVARGDHVHPLQTTVSGNAGSADKVNSNLVVKLNSGTTEGTDMFTFNGSAAKSINITPSAIGAAESSHGTHVSFSTTAPKANGTAAVGTATTVSRSDHVHPLQTTVSGNAGTATKFASAQSVVLTGDVTGSASSQAGWSVATTLANSGVTAGSYGPSANNAPGSAGTFSVPYVTVDAKGRVTAASSKTITMPTVSKTYSATIGTTWTGSAAPYTQTITVSGITANDNPIVDVVLSGTYATDEAALAEYAKVYRITTAANSITVYASDKTTASLDIQLKCISE